MNKAYVTALTPSQSRQPGLIVWLMAAAHAVRRATMEALLGSGNYPQLSLTYVSYIECIALRDYSPGELAGELGISKQACSKVVRELEGRGFITRRPHAEDSRSSVLSLTTQGLQLIRDGVEAANVVQQQQTEVIGTGRARRITAVLEQLCTGLALPVPEIALGMGRLTRLNQLLLALDEYYREQLRAALQADGYGGLRGSVGDVLGLIAESPMRIPYMAIILGLSKQAVALASVELERLGYATRSADPIDGRQLIVSLSATGEKLVAVGANSREDLEAAAQAVLSTADYRLLEEGMALWYDQIVEQHDTARMLGNRIQQLSTQLLADLGQVGARALAQQLIILTRGNS